MSRNLVPWRREKGGTAVSKVDESPLLDLHRRMNNMFADFFADLGGDFPWTQQSALAPHGLAAVPRVDVAETDDEIVVSADMPGLEEKDIQVTMDEDLLTIRGIRKEEREDKHRSYHLMERSYGEMQRVVQLPPGVDREKVKASFKNGVLRVAMPKLPSALPHTRKIEITGG